MLPNIGCYGEGIGTLEVVSGGKKDRGAPIRFMGIGYYDNDDAPEDCKVGCSPEECECLERVLYTSPPGTIDSSYESTDFDLPFLPLSSIASKFRSHLNWLEEPDLRVHKDCVYFITATVPVGDRIMCKIGFTSLPLRVRASHLRTGSPVPLTVSLVLSGGKELEVALHEHFKRQRQHGEWFSFDLETWESVLSGTFLLETG